MGPLKPVNNAGGFDSRIFTKIQKKFFGPFSFIRYIKQLKSTLYLMFLQGIPKCHFNKGTFYRIMVL